MLFSFFFIFLVLTQIYSGIVDLCLVGFPINVIFCYSGICEGLGTGCRAGDTGLTHVCSYSDTEGVTPLILFCEDDWTVIIYLSAFPFTLRGIYVCGRFSTPFYHIFGVGLPAYFRSHIVRLRGSIVQQVLTSFLFQCVGALSSIITRQRGFFDQGDDILCV